MSRDDSSRHLIPSISCRPTCGGPWEEGLHRLEQGSVLAGYTGWEYSAEPLTDEPTKSVVHNPTPKVPQ